MTRTRSARLTKALRERMPSTDPAPRGRIPITLQAFRVGFVGALGVALGITAFMAIGTISVVVTYVGVAYFLTLALEPVILWMGSKGVRRSAAVIIIFAILSILAAALVLAVAPLVGRQLISLAHRAPDALESLVKAPWFADATKQLGIDGSIDGLLSSVTDFLKDPAHLASIGSGLLSVGTTVVDGAVAVVIVLILTIYFTATLPKMTNKAFQIVPASRAGSWRPVYEEMTQSVGRYVIGQVSLAALNAALTFVLLLVFHVPGIALLTALGFVGALIPIVGTIVEAVVIIVVCLFTSPAAAIAAIIFYIVYHPVEAYVLSPRVMARAVHVPGALVVIAVLAGSSLGGVLGALVAVPVAAAVTILVERVIIVRQRAR